MTQQQPLPPAPHPTQAMTYPVAALERRFTAFAIDRLLAWSLLVLVGVGTAWLRSGVSREDTRILTAELDPALAEAAAEIFVDDDQVEVLAADWATLLDRGPFSLLFLDSGKPLASSPDKVVELMDDGGLVVLDDFTPCQSWPPLFEGRVDTLREEWLSDERFAAVEVLVAPDASAVIAAKR